MTASSDESSTYEDVREKLLVDYSVLFSPQFGAKEKGKKPVDSLSLQEKIYIHKSHLCFAI